MSKETSKAKAGRKIIAAVALALGAKAHAAPWCPSNYGNAVTCSNCSVELTCDVSGVSIYILGSNVTLEGNGHGIWWGPYDGIQAQGVGTTIRNVRIFGAGESAINFASNAWTNAVSRVENAYISSVNWEGVVKGGPQPLVIANTQIYYAGLDGVWSTGAGNTNLRNSLIYGSGEHGFAVFGNNSWVLNNTLTENGRSGITSSDVSGMLFENNTVNNNHYAGMYLSNVGGTVRYNNGQGNTFQDCFETHPSGVDISGYGNNFQYRYGQGCGN